jgi:hypothetical protein
MNRPLYHSFLEGTILVTVLFMCLLVVAGPTYAQRRDYMTEHEIELVRENQDIDRRIGVLVRMIDRRFAAMGIEVSGWKPRDRDLAEWGELPETSSVDLWWDIRQLLSKAMDDIDSIAERDANALPQNRTSGRLFPKAVKMLDEAARRYLDPLKRSSEAKIDERQRGLILNSIELCEQVIAAAANIQIPRSNR